MPAQLDDHADAGIFGMGPYLALGHLDASGQTDQLLGIASQPGFGQSCRHAEQARRRGVQRHRDLAHAPDESGSWSVSVVVFIQESMLPAPYSERCKSHFQPVTTNPP